ncbi:MAG: hypothetical protein IT514_09630 [Burkholderiales bacterium]|nr:hypothetical protein [Burkholderiales bacterium]
MLLIARHYMAHFNQKFKKSFAEIAPEAARQLVAYPWPGNVRELKNVLERVALLENDRILQVRHLPPELRVTLRPELTRVEARSPQAPGESGLEGSEEPVETTEGALPGDLSLALVEEQHILRVLRLTGGNKSQAARLLGISRQGLFERLKRFGEHEAEDVESAADAAPGRSVGA